MNYSELSDFEINMLVAKHLHPNVKLIKSNSRPNCVVALDVFAEGCNIWLDYCNNIQDAWSIMLENKISLVTTKEAWIAIPNNSTIDGWTGDLDDMLYFSNGYCDNNPLRAAMCVFLVMKDTSESNKAIQDLVDLSQELKLYE